MLLYPNHQIWCQSGFSWETSHVLLMFYCTVILVGRLFFDVVCFSFLFKAVSGNGGTIFFVRWHSYNKRPTRELVRTWPATGLNIWDVLTSAKVEKGGNWTSRCYGQSYSDVLFKGCFLLKKNMWFYYHFCLGYSSIYRLFMLTLFVCVELEPKRFGSICRRCAETTCSMHVGSAGFLANQKKECSSGGGEILRVQDWYRLVSSKSGF